MKVLNIGTYAIDENENDKVIEFLSNDNFLDGDILIINTNHYFTEIKNKYYDSRKINIASTKMKSLLEEVSKRQNDINEFLEHKKTIVVELDEKILFYFSEKSRNPVKFSILDLLPITIKCEPRIGENSVTIPNIESLKPFSGHSAIFKYNYTLESDIGLDLLKVKDTNYVISKYFKLEKGAILLIPTLNEKTRNAIKQNGVYTNIYSRHIKELITDLSIIGTNSSENEQIESWGENVTLKFELNSLTERRILNEKLALINNEIKGVDEKIKSDQELKSLVLGYGRTLENACVKVLVEIGFNIIEPLVDNRSDVTAKLDNQYYVFEIKGLVKSSKEKNAAQLQKWVSNFHYENEIRPKGILIVNGFRKEEVVNRNQPVFPNQMLEFCEKMELCLLNSSVFLSLILDLRNGIISKEEIIKLLTNTSGELNYEQSVGLEKISD